MTEWKVWSLSVNSSRRRRRSKRSTWLLILNSTGGRVMSCSVRNSGWRTAAKDMLLRASSPFRDVTTEVVFPPHASRSKSSVKDSRAKLPRKLSRLKTMKYRWRHPRLHPLPSTGGSRSCFPITEKPPVRI